MRRRGIPGVLPLWAERLTGPEVLTELEGVEEDWALLLVARASLEAERPEEAEEALARLSGLWPNLEALGKGLTAEVGRMRADGSRAEKTALEAWLSNVKAWKASAA